VDRIGLDIEDRDGTRRRIDAVCKVWAAGVAAAPLGAQLAAQTGAEVDRAGRVRVLDDLTLPGHPEVHVVGDMIARPDIPGVAQGAIQAGRHAADDIRNQLRGRGPKGAFTYRDKGDMATISRFYAVAQVGRVRTSGFLAWLLWLAVHLLYVVGFKSRVTTLLHWTVSFLGRARPERTTTAQQVFARQALLRRGDPGNDGTSNRTRNP
jgi:NADH dehydrogenase